MMGQHKSDPQLFNYAVNLEKRENWRKIGVSPHSWHNHFFLSSDFVIFPSSMFAARVVEASV
jgi:hypothetical protein